MDNYFEFLDVYCIHGVLCYSKLSTCRNAINETSHSVCSHFEQLQNTASEHTQQVCYTDTLLISKGVLLFLPVLNSYCNIIFTL
jgi:hypothetical protein